MKRWLPRLVVESAAILEEDGESEGVSVRFVWLGLTLEVAIAHRVRTVERID